MSHMQRTRNLRRYLGKTNYGLLQSALDQGCKLLVGGKHMMVVTPSGVRVAIPNTPRDATKAEKYFARNLARAGIAFEGE